MLALQQHLKKEFLLIEKEQQEKVKLKKEIEDHLTFYYQTLIEAQDSTNILVKDDGFENCYNFVKDVLIGVSQNITIAHCLLKEINREDSKLMNFFVNIVYESLESTDPFEKDITRLMHLLICDLFEESIEINKKEKILRVFEQYMKREEITMYFDMLASISIREIIQLSQELALAQENMKEQNQNRHANTSAILETENESNRYSQSSQASSVISNSKKIIIINDKGKHFKEFYAEKNTIIKNYLEKIFKDSDLCPIAIKILLKSCFESVKRRHKKEEGLKIVWKLISPFLVKPFFNFLENDYISSEAKKICLEIINYLIHEYHMVERLLYENLVPSKILQQEGSPTASKKIKLELIYGKVVEKLIDVQRDKYEQKIVKFDKSQESEADEKSIQIKIFGGCISFKELAELMNLIIKYKEILVQKTIKVVNRAIKIFEMSPQLTIFEPSKKHCHNNPNINADQIYISIVELQYSKFIEYDFHKEYTQVYKNDNLKNILRQVMIEVEINENLPSRQFYVNGSNIQSQESMLGQGSMLNTFICIHNEAKKPGSKSNISAPVLMKIKYLIWLLSEQSQGRNPKILESLQNQLISEMMKEFEGRCENNIKLYEDTKFSLLKVFSNLKDYRSGLKEKKEVRKSTQQKLELIGWLDHLRFALCLTSPSTRNGLEREDQQKQIQSNKYKYRISSSDEMIICETKDCIHKENVFLGRKCHAYHIISFIQIFCQLKEVKHCIIHPDFLSPINHKNIPENIYQSKERVRHSFYHFVKLAFSLIKKEQPLNQDNYYKHQIQEILLRSMNQQLVCSQTIIDKNQIEDQKSLIRSMKDIQFEQKLYEIATTIQNISKLVDGKKAVYKAESNQISIDQLIQIGCRSLRTLNQAKTPQEKIKKLREIFDVYKTLLKKHQDQLKNYPQEYIVFKMLVNVKPKNFITNLNFIETFLNEEKLLSIEGNTLECFKNVVKKIATSNLDLFLEQEISLFSKENGKDEKAGNHQELIKNVILEGKMERELQKHKVNSVLH